MPIAFKPTKDEDLIRSVVCDPRVYSKLWGDDAGPAEEWQPISHPMVSYFAIVDGKRFVGIVITVRESRIKLAVHNVILPEIGWKRRLEIVLGFFDWAAEHGIRRVTGRVASSNRYALRFNEAAGMKMFGIDEKAIMKNGVLEDEHLFGISLPIGGVPSLSADF